jgi:hypothetical protein
VFHVFVVGIEKGWVFKHNAMQQACVPIAAQSVRIIAQT